MTKLKTLKDMKCLPTPLGDKMISSKEVRQEAIKWYKSLTKNINKRKKPSEKTKRIVKGQIEILRLFFNITEEDLK